jgi:hypothetical protein
MGLEFNSVLDKSKKIHCALQEHIFDLNHLFITITGDSAYSGKNEEYMQVIDMIEGISLELKSIKEDIEISYIIIPGNHDCDFSAGKPTIRNMIVKNIQGEFEDMDSAMMDEMVSPQFQYFEYLKYFEPVNKNVDDKLFKSYTISQGSTAL